MGANTSGDNCEKNANKKSKYLVFNFPSITAGGEKKMPSGE